MKLKLDQFDFSSYENIVQQYIDSGFVFKTLADFQKDEMLPKLYEFFVETSKDNPGQYGDVVPYKEWLKEFCPDEMFKDELVYIALYEGEIAGLSQLLLTDDEGELYTNYTGVHM